MIEKDESRKEMADIEKRATREDRERQKEMGRDEERQGQTRRNSEEEGEK